MTARRLVVLMALLAAAATGATAYAAGPDEQIVLPGATGAEGITDGAGTTFYAGDLFTGDIFRGDVRQGTADLFIDAPDGRMATGMDFDPRSGLLFVAGGCHRRGVRLRHHHRHPVASYQFASPGATFVNDVTVTREGAWFTDSAQAKLYFVPIGPAGGLGTHQTLALSGPAADLSGDFNNNGIAATPNGKTLIVAHSGQGALNTVDPATGQSATIAGVERPERRRHPARGRPAVRRAELQQPDRCRGSQPRT